MGTNHTTENTMTTPTPDRLPLWLLMEAAYHKRRDPGLSERHDYAREIRAVRDEIERWQIENYAVVLTDVREVLAWLSSQADHAEQGDG